MTALTSVKNCGCLLIKTGEYKVKEINLPTVFLITCTIEIEIYQLNRITGMDTG